MGELLRRRAMMAEDGGATIDTTAVIEYSGYVLNHRTGPDRLAHTAKTYGGITVLYEMDAPSTVLYPAGIIKYNNNTISNAVGAIGIYDSDGNYLTYVNEKTASSDNRWAQASTNPTEYSQKWSVGTFNKIAFSVDILYLDDSYMYDKETGQVWFAGRNTPYYGKKNIND